MELFYEVTEGGHIEVTSPYHQSLPRRARALGGRWNATRKVWRFSYTSIDAVLALYTEVYGMQPAKRYQGPPHEFGDPGNIPPRRFVATEHGDTVRVGPEPGEPPRMVRAVAGLKPGDRVNVTLKDGKIRELLVENKEWALDKSVGIPYAELELRAIAHEVAGLFTPDGLLDRDFVCGRKSEPGALRYRIGRELLVLAVNERLAALDKKVKMLMAERGPGIKPEPELVVPVDHGWDD